jgi:hypothetical protein
MLRGQTTSPAKNWSKVKTHRSLDYIGQELRVNGLLKVHIMRKLTTPERVTKKFGDLRSPWLKLRPSLQKNNQVVLEKIRTTNLLLIECRYSTATAQSKHRSNLFFSFMRPIPRRKNFSRLPCSHNSKTRAMDGGMTEMP